MSETKFTPGPWSVNFDSCEDIFISSESGEYISEIGSQDGTKAKADAHLIAAAPDMYETLDMLMSVNGPGDAAQLLAEERENIMRLLAKARGEK